MLPQKLFWFALKVTVEVKCNFLKIYKEKCKALNLIKAPALIILVCIVWPA